MRANLSPSRFGRVSIDLPQTHRNLMRAVLVQAVLDGMRPPFVTNTRPDAPQELAQHNITKNNRRRINHVKAREWLLCTDPDTRWPFTSEVIFQALDYNANAIRTRIREGKVDQWNTLLTKIRDAMC